MSRFAAHSLLLVSILAVAGCTFRFRATASLYVRPSAGTSVTEACPPLAEPEEERTTKTDPRTTWIAGHWRWDGDWVWIQGTWIVVDEGHTWEPPVCTVSEGAPIFYPGFFRPTATEPPPVYREPGHIRMSCPIDEEAILPPRIDLTQEIPFPENTGPNFPMPEVPGSDVNVGGPSVEIPGGTVDPGTDPGTTNPGTTDPGTNPGTTPTVTGPEVGPNPPPIPGETLPEVSLTCSVLVNRVPESGYVTLQGTGFSGDAEVTIGGRRVGIRRSTATELVVGAAQGPVRVRVGTREAACGEVSLLRGR